MLTDKQVHDLSTATERTAAHNWKALQEQAKVNGYMNEGDLLLASQVCSILIERNKRLGLIK